MFTMTDEEAWKAYQREEISIGEYLKIRDSIKEQTFAQAGQQLAEKTAQEVENLVKSYGGNVGSRRLVQIPNPWASETQNLTNQMLLLNRAKKGDLQAIALLSGGDDDLKLPSRKNRKGQG